MSWRNTTERYGKLSAGLHWLMLLLITAVYVLMEFRGIFPRHSAGRSAMRTWHYMLGLSVLALVLLRMALAVAGPTPGIAPAPGKLGALFSRLMHAALYAFMIAMPILGWMTLSAGGDPIPFWGLQLPPLIAVSDARSESLGDLHGTIANIGYGLIGLHAAAGLFHHYWLRDNTLRRMLPWLRND